MVVSKGDKNRAKGVEWVGIGVALGVALGAAMDNIGAGIAIGVAIGAALAAGQRGRKSSAGQADEDETGGKPPE